MEVVIMGVIVVSPLLLEEMKRNTLLDNVNLLNKNAGEWGTEQNFSLAT